MSYGIQLLKRLFTARHKAAGLKLTRAEVAELSSFVHRNGGAWLRHHAWWKTGGAIPTPRRRRVRSWKRDRRAR